MLTVYSLLTEKGRSAWQVFVPCLFRCLLPGLLLCIHLVCAADNFESTKEAAEKGDSFAQFNLGVMYYRGDGTAKDYARAIHWFHKAAEQNHVMSQLMVGIMYADGKGVPRDADKAARWYRKSAEQGDRDAQRRLGDMYYGGRGVTRDESKAARWYRKAAEQGDAVAQHMIGSMYEWSLGGLRKDIVEAYAWYGIAYENGHEPAGWGKASLAKVMTAAQLSQAEDLFQSYLRAYTP